MMRKYRERLIDLADAALLDTGEREGVRKFFTVDQKDFSVYRLHGRLRPIILPSGAAPLNESTLISRVEIRHSLHI